MSSKQSDRLKKVKPEILLGILAQARARDFDARMPLHRVAGDIAPARD